MHANPTQPAQTQMEELDRVEIHDEAPGWPTVGLQQAVSTLELF